MRMQTTPGQRIFTISGRHYSADQAGFIDDVDPEDVSELSRVGCRIVAAAEVAPPPPAPARVAAEAAAEPLDPAIGHHEAPERSE